MVVACERLVVDAADLSKAELHWALIGRAAEVLSHWPLFSEFEKNSVCKTFTRTGIHEGFWSVTAKGMSNRFAHLPDLVWCLSKCES